MGSQLIDTLTASHHPRMLVVGDVMLDRYLWGDVQRISPEAPIPVLRVGREEHRLGGAGSVAAMLAALEANVILAAVTGDDREGRIVRGLLDQLHVDSQCVLASADRTTTIKERFLGRTQSRQPQQMIRIDREDTHPIEAELVEELIQAVGQQVDQLDLIVISDYAKGVCAGDFVSRIVTIAQSAGVPVLADPIRSSDYRRYAGCSCLKPNRTEAGLATGIEIRSVADGLEAARRLLALGLDVAVVTLDREGIVWADAKGRGGHCPARPRQVYDITGAGDMVISALGYCLALGTDYPIAIELANLAGGLEVERLGVAPLSRQDLLAELHRAAGTKYSKVLSREQLGAQLERRRQSGEKIVMTNGCFDLLHPGHVASLEEAAKHGDCLIVGLNSDRSIAELKGPGRPVVDQQGRAEMLAALACVDYVVVFDEASVAGLVAHVRPDVLVKSDQYAVEQVVGHDVVRRHGGRVVLVPMRSDYSTSGLIRKIAELATKTLDAEPDRRDTLPLHAPEAKPGPAEAAA